MDNGNSNAWSVIYWNTKVGGFRRRSFGADEQGARVFRAKREERELRCLPVSAVGISMHSDTMPRLCRGSEQVS